jgi:hypothetical protein
VIRWSAKHPTGIDAIEQIVDVVQTGEGFVLVAEMPYDNDVRYTAWRSSDGRRWQLAHRFPAGQRILAVATTQGRVVAGGGSERGPVVWASVDGRDWRQIADPSLRGGVISRLIPTASGIVAFGNDQDGVTGAIWTSPDAVEWLAATNQTGRAVARGLQAVESYGGRSVAIVREGDSGPAAIWETTGRAEWTRVGTLPDDTAIVHRLAGGKRGWVAVGSSVESPSVAWTSVDGRTWADGVSGPEVSEDLIVDAAGYVAVGHVGSLPGETCGDQRPFAGLTWTSADGSTWKRMPVAKEFNSAMVRHLLIVDRTLVGFGERFKENSGFQAGRWVAPLPELSLPVVAPDEPSVAKSCGG